MITVTSQPASEFDLTLDQGTEAKWNVLAVKELESKTCYCGAKKGTMQTFCRAEYFALPKRMRDALYDRIGQGYKEAYQAARAYLFNRKTKKGATR